MERPVEVTVIMVFSNPWDAPTRDDIEYAFDCDVIEYESEEV
jgi:hypothetical protein